MPDGPRTSMHGVPADRWERVFGPSKKRGQGTSSSAGAATHFLAVPDAVPEQMSEADARAAMDSMAGKLVQGGHMSAEAANRVARQSALRRDAMNQGRAHGHIETRKP